MHDYHEYKQTRLQQALDDGFDPDPDDWRYRPQPRIPEWEDSLDEEHESVVEIQERRRHLDEENDRLYAERLPLRCERCGLPAQEPAHKHAQILCPVCMWVTGAYRLEDL